MKNIFLISLLALLWLAGCHKAPASNQCLECIAKRYNVVLDTTDYCNGLTPPYGSSGGVLSGTYFVMPDSSTADSAKCYVKQ